MSDTIAKLSHNQFSADIQSYLETKAEKKRLDAASRQADGIIKKLRSLLFIAMKGASVAKCGNAILTIKPEKQNLGALTLKDGRSIPLDAIKEIVFVHNGIPDVIAASDVSKWYGGSVTGADLEVTLTGSTV